MKVEEGTQLRGGREASLAAPVALLRSSQVLRARKAGWTSPRDRAFLVPILAWVHSALLTGPGRWSLGHGENSPAYDAVFIGVKQARRYKAALELMGVAAADELRMPSFAKHFVNGVLALYEGVPSHTASSLVKRTVHLSGNVLDAIFRALERADDVGSRLVDGVSQESARPDENRSLPALEKLMVLDRNFHHDLHIALRFDRVEASMDRIQSRKRTIMQDLWKLADESKTEAEFLADRKLKTLRSMPLDSLQRIFVQYRYFTIYYISDMAQLVHRLPFGKLRSLIAEFLSEELGEGNAPDAHPKISTIRSF